MMQHGLRWPFVVLDFEASSLDKDLSYPIEAGVAHWAGPMAPVLTWSSLIEPHPQWVRDGVWLLEAQRVHGISPMDLEGAPKPCAVHARMAGILGDAAFVSDNPFWERMWLDRLRMAAGSERVLPVEGLTARLADVDDEARRLAADHLKTQTQRHRAADDALAIVLAVAHGLGKTPEVVPA
jgi:hypothetical protein